MIVSTRCKISIYFKTYKITTKMKIYKPNLDVQQYGQIKKRVVGIMHLIEKKLLNFAKVKMFMKLLHDLVLWQAKLDQFYKNLKKNYRPI